MPKMMLPALLACALVAGCQNGLAVTAGGAVTEDLSVTPKAAYAMLRAHPDTVHLVDVRTPAEYIWVGHATMARNIPVQFLTRKWDAAAGGLVVELNPTFVDDVARAYRPTDTILVMCHSGRRGLDAMAQLRKAGWKDVLNVAGGFAGFRGMNCDCPGAQPVIKPGWKESNLPWTYDLEEGLMYLEQPQPVAATRATPQ
jgi:rhodanese-related sulfurtransferase